MTNNILHTAVVLGLALIGSALLTGCSSINGEIADLKNREIELHAEISDLTDERKRIIGLITALEQLQREGSRQAEADVEEARERLDEAADKNS